MPEIHRKPHVPNVTLAVIESPENSHIRLTGFNFVYIIFHFARFPAHNGIFTRLWKRKMRKKKDMLCKELNLIFLFKKPFFPSIIFLELTVLKPGYPSTKYSDIHLFIFGVNAHTWRQEVILSTEFNNTQKHYIIWNIHFEVTISLPNQIQL